MQPPARVLLLTDARMEAHRSSGHPERPERLAAAVAGVEAGAGAAGAELQRGEPRAVSDELLTAIHDPLYLAALERAAKAGGGWLDADTYLVGESMVAARLAAGATVDAAVAVARGEAAIAFAAVRPPGHHAARERGSGFCLFNNVAIAVAALRTAGLARRIAIVDWDVHHGDGTQSIFAADADLWYGSTHQSPLFPGTGAVEERGIGPARGTKHNVPLPPGAGDEALLLAWRDELLPALEAFAPDAILVSAGYDATGADPLAALRVSDAGYRELGLALGEVVQRLQLPGIALALEGGYDLAALASGVAATLVGLLAGMRPAGGAHLYSGPR
jgi:acetoin utilization deacetylase AcuC-like enzyme